MGGLDRTIKGASFSNKGVLLMFVSCVSFEEKSLKSLDKLWSKQLAHRELQDSKVALWRSQSGVCKSHIPQSSELTGVAYLKVELQPSEKLHTSKSGVTEIPSYLHDFTINATITTCTYYRCNTSIYHRHNNPQQHLPQVKHAHQHLPQVKHPH